MDWHHGTSTGNTVRPAWLARRDARARLLAVLPLMVGLALLQHWLGVLIFSFLIAGVFCTGSGRYGRGGLAVLSTSILLPWSVDTGGYQVAMLYFVKSVTQFMLVAIVWQTAPLHVHAVAAQRLGMPAVLCQLLTLMWRHVQLLSAEWHRIKLALQTRYFRQRFNHHSRQTLSQAMGTLIVRTHQRGERVSQAMRCRGFQGRFHTLETTHWKWADTLLVLSMWTLMACLVWWDRLS